MSVEHPSPATTAPSYLVYTRTFHVQFSECSTQAEHDPAMLKKQPNQQEIKGSNEPAGADEQRQREEVMLGSPQSLTPQHEAAVASQAPILMASGIWQHPAELPRCQKTRNNTQQEGKKWSNNLLFFLSSSYILPSFFWIWIFGVNGVVESKVTRHRN